MIPRRLRLLWSLLTALALTGCATPPAVPPAATPGEAPLPSPSTAVTEPAPMRFFPDRDLLDEGIALLQRERPEPVQAREAFTRILQQYPQSRWRPAAEAFIRLVDASLAAREAESKTQRLTEQLLAERGQALQEKEQLKKTLQEWQARLQAETGALNQENEQLKKDLQRLKALEIELERRERLLR